MPSISSTTWFVIALRPCSIVPSPALSPNGTLRDHSCTKPCKQSSKPEDFCVSIGVKYPCNASIYCETTVSWIGLPIPMPTGRHAARLSHMSLLTYRYDCEDLSHCGECIIMPTYPMSDAQLPFVHSPEYAPRLPTNDRYITMSRMI